MHSGSITLTADIVIPLTGEPHPITEELVLNRHVAWTLSHSAHQVFTNWGTWSAIVVAVFGAGSWLWKKRRSPRATPDSENDPSKDDTAT